MDAYLEVAELGEDRKGPLFRSCAVGRQDLLEDRAMTRATALRMIKRRARKAGLPAEICAHSFRGTGITEYLRNGGDLEVAARIAGHESTRHHAALQPGPGRDLARRDRADSHLSESNKDVAIACAGDGPEAGILERSDRDRIDRLITRCA